MPSSHVFSFSPVLIVLTNSFRVSGCIPGSNQTSADRYPINRHFNVTSGISLLNVYWQQDRIDLQEKEKKVSTNNKQIKSRAISDIHIWSPLFSSPIAKMISFCVHQMPKLILAFFPLIFLWIKVKNCGTIFLGSPCIFLNIYQM